MEPRRFKVQFAPHAKVIFIILFFFGIVLDWGSVDIVALFKARQQALLQSVASANPVQPQGFNRSQRRRLMHQLKQRNAQAY